MSADDSCVFCEIVAGRAAASVPFEDELVVCVMDLHPVNPGHLLVIPKRHAAGLHELDEDTGAHMFRVAMRMRRALRASPLPCDGVNLLLADGESAWQDVFHAHLHVIPRLAGDRLRITVELMTPTRDDLDHAAAVIRAAC
jgi:diadenosine tetraphosphate (Ap4A) HIT family hydrolase